MSDDMRTAEKFMQAVNAMKQTLDTRKIEEVIDLDIAVDHNLRRKTEMIRAMENLYAYLHGNGPKPGKMPSEAFNPFEGADKTNIHYIFKYMTSVPPWELRKDALVMPIAMTLLMLEIAAKLFPDKEVFELTILFEEFINRWTLPKFRSEWSEEELKFEIATYKADMADLEKRIKKAYANLALYFGSIEKPERDPEMTKITETHKRTKAIAERICPREENASFVAQKWAYDRWLEFKTNPVAKTQYCIKDHRLNHADCFDFYKRQAIEHGFKNATQFGKAITAAGRRDQDA